MKITLVGWDIDDGVVGELARLGLECVVYTRWFPGRPVREERGGWTLVRCPHELGGGPRGEAESFGRSVLRSAEQHRLGTACQVVHALDARALPALSGFKAWWPRALGVGTIDEVENLDGSEPVASSGVDCWICGHPWTASQWRQRNPGDGRPIAVVASRVPAAVAPGPEAGPLMLILLAGDDRFEPGVVAEALARASQAAPGLRAAVLGPGRLSGSLQRSLSDRGYLADEPPRGAEASLAGWRAVLAGSAVVGLGTRALAADPAARAAWLAGKPVVSLDVAEPERLAQGILDALYPDGPARPEVASAAALARRLLEPDAVARAWLGLYLDGWTPHGSGPALPRHESCAPLDLSARRSRLSLLAVGPRQAYASWSVGPADWSTALEWLGPGATRAVLAIRLADVPGLKFRGDNAHASWDADLSFCETERVIVLDAPGRCLAATLGVRAASGHFHPLAHARLCHLPAEALAPAGPTRRLRVLPRREPTPATAES